jgi:hypothetical protein
LIQVLTQLVNETFEIGQIKRFENFLSKDQSTLFALVNNQPYTLHVKLEPKIRQSAEQEVIDFKMADVFGTGHNYYIYLLGSRIYGEVSPYVGKLGLVIKDTNNETVKIIPLEVEEGYKPQLFIGDFTGDKADDVMVSIFTKSSLDAAASYIYHIEGEQVKLILNTPQLLNNESTQVIYQDQYKVEVLPALTQKVYPLDMSHKSESYLDELYDLEGHLLHKYTGQIEEAMTIVPLDYDGNQVYYVLIIQRIMGISSEDFLGTVETILKWQPDIKAFIPTSQYVAIYGQDKITE